MIGISIVATVFPCAIDIPLPPRKGSLDFFAYFEGRAPLPSSRKKVSARRTGEAIEQLRLLYLKQQLRQV
jgi:hypothetical protein